MEEKYDIENSLLKNLKEKSKLEFDYEIRNTKLEEKENLNSKMYYFHNDIKKYSIITNLYKGLLTTIITGIR